MKTFRITLRRLVVPVFCLGLIIAMEGCVGIALRHTPGTGAALTSSRTVTVDVQDHRDFVVDGTKPGSYLGHFRGGYGNTWDVNNAGGRTLAAQFKDDLVAELDAHGIKTLASGERKILVDIRQWNFDAYQNGRIWYEMVVSVTDASGVPLASVTLKNEQVIRGNFWTGAPGAFKRKVPVVYSNLIKEILGNREIQQALK